MFGHVIMLGVAVSSSLVSASVARVPCGSLANHSPLLPDNVSSLTATPVAIAALEVGSTSYNNTIAVCRVTGSIKFGCKGNNTLNFEVWLPDELDWNQRYLSVGNGGFAGTIDYAAMLTNLNSGYAVGGCDSGHPVSANGGATGDALIPFFHDRDETLAWIHNSIAMFTPPAKRITTIYYNGTPKKSYYSGCSTGGAQGFALAQFHPTIFDGIYAGSPGNHYSHLMLSFLWNGMNSEDTASFLGPDALQLITTAVLDECDTLDGAADRLLDDPTKCSFDIMSLLCADGQQQLTDNSTVCLSAAQIENARQFYAGPRDRRTGKQLYPGFALGSETQWTLQESALYLDYAVPLLQNLVFKDLSYNYTTFNWGSDVDTLDRQASPLIDEISPDLRAYKEGGGKLIVTQGWADPFNAPTWPIEQREEMRKLFGDDLSTFYSLFMIPGGGHCGAVSSTYLQVPGTYHVLERLVSWVEEGQVPQDLLITNPPDNSGATRLLLPYN